MKKIFVLFLFFIFAKGFCQEEEILISPSSGVFANKQVLVLSLEDTQEAYYSFSQGDPATSGFMYDGPVLIDLEGKVELYVCVIDEDGTRKDISTKYEVSPCNITQLVEEANEDSATRDFLTFVDKNPLIRYDNGKDFFIPSSCKFSFGNTNKVMSKGRNVKITQNCNVLRYVPCEVCFANARWRFVLHTVPLSSGAVTKKTVPFEVKDWDTVAFTNKKLIYKIDEGMWEQPLQDAKIDRNTQHTIYWQSVDYRKGNVVSSCILPARPKIVSRQNPDGSISFSFSTSSMSSSFSFFDLTSKKDLQLSPGAFSSVILDTFFGDRFSGEMKVAVFFEGVFQGTQKLDFDIDKTRPACPIMETASKSQNGFFRDDIVLDITPAALGDSVYYSVKKDIEGEKTPSAGEYALMDKKSILLEGDKDRAVTYTVFSYAKSKNGNESDIAKYVATIDGTDFFLDAKSTNEVQDGSKDAPFKTLEDAFAVLSKRKFSRLFVSGDVTMRTKQLSIKNDCKIVAQGQSRIFLPSRANIFVSGCSFEILGCTIETLPEDKTNIYDEVAVTTPPPVFSCTNSTFSLSGCDVLDNSSSSSCIIDATNSIVSLNDAGITSRSLQYSCAVSCHNSKLLVKSCRIISIADTAVCFSVTKNSFDLRSSSCNVVGKIGRIMELVDVKTSLVNNVFEASLNSAVELAAIWKDPATVILKNDSNRESGF